MRVKFEIRVGRRARRKAFIHALLSGSSWKLPMKREIAKNWINPRSMM